MYPEIISQLIDNFKKFPGVGQKSAERMAFAVIEKFKEDDYNDFSESIMKIKEGIKHCSICNSLTDKEICDICSDKTRNKDTLIVVENFKDVFLMEKKRGFIFMTNFSFLQKKPNSYFYIRRKLYCYVFISFLIHHINVKGGLI